MGLLLSVLVKRSTLLGGVLHDVLPPDELLLHVTELPLGGEDFLGLG